MRAERSTSMKSKNIVTKDTTRAAVLLREAIKLCHRGKENQAIQFYLTAKDVMGGRPPTETESFLIDAVRIRIARHLGLAQLP
jgi:hypothetical protein